MGAPAVLRVDIIADATKALKAMGLVEEKAKGGMGLTKTAKAIGGLVGTGAILKFGKDAIDAAAGDAEAQEKLAQTIRNVTGANQKQIDATEDWISKTSMATALADDDLRPALDKLVRGFGNTEDAQKALALATDVSAGSGKDLATVTDAMMKAANGSTGALSKLGIKTKDASGKALSLNEIMGEMSKTFGGQAAKAADTTAGRMRNAQIQMGELSETIGGALLPIIAELAPMVSKLAGFFQENARWLAPLVGIIIGLVAAMKVWTMVQTALNIVMAANPIVLVVLAIAALVAGIILAYNKVGWFRDLCDVAFSAIADAFGWITEAAKTVFSWLKSNWPILLAILTGPFGIAVALIVKNWDTIKAGAEAAVQFVKDKWNALIGFFTGLADKIGGIIGGLRDTISNIVGGIAGAVDRIVSAIKNPINAVIRAWNRLEFTTPSVDLGPLGSFGGVTIGFPDIPTLARGGMVMRTGMALVHEGERFSGVGRGFGSTTVNINVTTTGLGADAPDIQRAVVNALRSYTARNGPLGAPIVAA